MQQVELRRNIAIISDILLWAVLLIGVSGLVYFVYLSHPEEYQQTVHLPFRDANELTRGSTVRMMGTEIGHVEAIHLKQHYVEVVIKTLPGTLRIPSGSTFTVLFTGIAGSKSIEVVPPDKPRPGFNGKPVYIVENPVRLKQALQVQIDTSVALQRGAENFADFFGRKKPVEELQFNIITSREATFKAHEHLVNAQHIIEDKRRDVLDAFTDVRDTVQDFAQASHRAVSILDPHYIGPTVYSAIRYFGLLFSEGEASLRNVQVEKRINHYNMKVVDSNEQLQRGPVKLRQWVKTSGKIHQNLETVDGKLTKAQKALQGPLQRKLQHVDQHIRQAHQQLEHLNKSL